MGDGKFLCGRGFRARRIVGGWFYRGCMVSSTGSGGLPVWDAVGCLTAAVDGLAGAGLWRCGDAELLDLQQVVETAARRLSAASLRLVAEVDDRRLATARGAAGTAALLRQLLNISAAEAGWRVTAAEKLLDRTGPSGAAVPAALPATAAGVRRRRDRGGAGPADLRHDPPAARRVDADTRAHAEAFLAGQAREVDTTTLGKSPAACSPPWTRTGRRSMTRKRSATRELSFGRGPDGMTSSAAGSTPRGRRCCARRWTRSPPRHRPPRKDRIRGPRPVGRPTG